MWRFRGSALLLVGLGSLCAQAPPSGPVVTPRGVINGFTLQPAPSTVAPGGIIWIHGINLGPAEEVKAQDVPLPLKLGDPPVEVLINATAAPLYSASPDRIVAQVPWETRPGIARIVVRRNDVQSRTARVIVAQPFPSVRTREDRGFGDADYIVSGDTLTVFATGLGPTEPPVRSGEGGPQDPPASPRAGLRAYIGGLPARVTAALSPQRPGEFSAGLQIPEAAQPGDIVMLIAGNRAANRTTFGTAAGVDVSFLGLPEDAPALRGLVSSDLRGGYAAVNGPRNDDGCYTGYLFDFPRRKMSSAGPCLITASPNAPTPFVATIDGIALAALTGPPQGEASAGLSTKVSILNPTREEVAVAELPTAVSTLTSAAGGNLTAIAPGTPPSVFTINAQTAEVRQGAAAGEVANPGSGPVNARNPEVDLGEGLTHVLSAPVQLAQGVLVVLVGDDESRPARAKLAVLSAASEVQATLDFPAGWLPLVAPAPPAPAPGGGPGGGAPGGIPAPVPDPAQGAPRFRVATLFEPETRTFYVLSRRDNGSAHGFAAFAIDDRRADVAAFPDSWFAAACTPNIRIFNLELTGNVALLGSLTPEEEFKNPCPSQGFLVLDVRTGAVSAAPLPGQGQINASGDLRDVNDYVYGANMDPSRRGISDTLFVLDGVRASSFRLDLPSGVTGFANLGPVPSMGILVGLASNSQPGDSGLVLFDLEAETARLLPTPEGFASVSLVGVFDTTRKVAARGVKADGSGSQYLIYDLLTGDLLMPPNPEGVAWVAVAPRPPGPAGSGPVAQIPLLERVSPKANYITAVGYDERRRPAGVIAIRIP